METSAKSHATGRPPENAATASAATAAPWTPAVQRHQRPFERRRETAHGVTSCAPPPTSSGTVATRPVTVLPAPSANAKAGKYISPAPTMTLNIDPSTQLARRSRRRTDWLTRRGMFVGGSPTCQGSATRRCEGSPRQPPPARPPRLLPCAPDGHADRRGAEPEG